MSRADQFTAGHYACRFLSRNVKSRMEEEPVGSFDLDAAGRLALEVALGTAGAIGDDRCGTEYLLFGVIATATGDVAELASLFALDTLRIERAINHLRSHRYSLEHDGPGDPPLSPRAEHALRTRRADGPGPTGPFEILHGALADDSAGACQVLRELGVRPDEVRRLVAYGIRHLSSEQIEQLIQTLDRRGGSHRGWWGPPPGGPLRVVPLGEPPLEVGRSVSVIASMQSVQVGPDGFGFSLVLESRRPWLLPPILQPSEILVPGRAPEHHTGPDTLRLGLVFADGRRADSLQPFFRWDPAMPSEPRLLLLGSRSEITRFNDRRLFERHVLVADWWVWPTPPAGTVELRVDWPAEMLSGLASFDGRDLVNDSQASDLRTA